MPVERKNVQGFLKNGEGGEYFRTVFVRECDLKTDEIRDRKTERESQRENQAQHWWQCFAGARFSDFISLLISTTVLAC
jgi:hypothetical protein